MRQSNSLCEDLQTTPLVTPAVQDFIRRRADAGNEEKAPFDDVSLDQYALLGFHTGHHADVPGNEPILLNVNAPNSTFICGSQGSGKSYTLNCMLENCLIADARIGTVNSPVAGVAFHYDPDSARMVAETAHLCSTGVPVNVLVSQSNEHTLKRAYKALPGADRHLTVKPMLLRPDDLNIERMHRLMAFADKEGAMPLYMSVALRVLRQMAVETRGNGFNYQAFRSNLERESLTKDQLGPLNMRLEILESFLDIRESRAGKPSGSLFDVQPGTLTIIDLSDPFMDPATACALFDICLGLFKEHRPQSGLVVALDEAHKFMTASVNASQFTESILRTVREHRHNATRVIIATQEPTVSEKLLDLCSMSIIHRFASPAWYGTIRSHLGATSKYVSTASQEDTMFNKIMELDVGESFLFAPTAFLRLGSTGMPCKLGTAIIRMKTRRRMGSDGGKSILAVARPIESLSGFRSVQESVNGYRHVPSLLDVACGNRVAVMDATSTSASAHSRGPIDGRLNRTLDTRCLVGTNSHLVLICCLCSSSALVGFPSRYLPGLPDVDQGSLRTGLAYATCVQCQLKHAGEKKAVLKRFELAQGKAFRDGTINVSCAPRDQLRTGLGNALGSDITILRRNGELVYLFLRVVQRLMPEQSWIWTLCPNRDTDGAPTVNILAHQDGSFIKASLRPNAMVT